MVSCPHNKALKLTKAEHSRNRPSQLSAVFCGRLGGGLATV
jgi:hypothetical protein